MFNDPDGPFAHEMTADAIKAALNQYGGR